MFDEILSIAESPEARPLIDNFMACFVKHVNDTTSDIGQATREIIIALSNRQHPIYAKMPTAQAMATAMLVKDVTRKLTKDTP